MQDCKKKTKKKKRIGRRMRGMSLHLKSERRFGGVGEWVLILISVKRFVLKDLRAKIFHSIDFFKIFTAVR